MTQDLTKARIVPTVSRPMVLVAQVLELASIVQLAQVVGEVNCVVVGCDYRSCSDQLDFGGSGYLDNCYYCGIHLGCYFDFGINHCDEVNCGYGSINSLACLGYFSLAFAWWP